MTLQERTRKTRVRPRLTKLSLLGAALASLVTAGAVFAKEAETTEDRVEEAPPELEGVTLTEKLRAALPMQRRFKDDSGAPVTLEDYFQDGLPVILTFNYSNCPMLCSVQLGGLVKTLNDMKWKAGVHFRILTIGLDPKETHRKAHDTKMSYLARYPAESADLGWTFLTGDEKDITAVAEAVGFGYRYFAARGEYLHPAALTVISPRGRVSGYLYGVAYEASDLRAALEAAAIESTSEATEKFLLSCFHYESPKGFAGTALRVMRYGGLVFVFGLVAVFGAYRVRSRRRELDSQ